MRDVFYLLVRLYLAWQWLASVSSKSRDPGWISTGEEVRRFCERASTVPPPPARPPVAFGWYRSVLKMMAQGDRPRYLARVLVIGQLVSGVGLLLGVQTRKAAAIGLAQNLSFSLAGSSGQNPPMLLAAELLVLAPGDVGRLGLASVVRRRS